MLNDIQQQVLHNLFNSYILSKLLPNDKCTSINILLSITNDNVYLANHKLFERMGQLEGVQYFREVFSHSCPQNVATSFVPDTIDSKSNLVKYKDHQGNVISEQRGIIGLTSLNDDSCEAVTKEDVTHYLQVLIESELNDRGYQQGSSDVVDLDDAVHEINSAVSEISFASIRSKDPPSFAELSSEAQNYWKVLTQLLETDQLFKDYNDVKTVWSQFNADTQQRVVSELQSMMAECLVLYDVSIVLLLKFGIVRTHKSYSSSDFTEYIQQLLEVMEPSLRQTNLLTIFYFSRGFAYFLQKSFEEAIVDFTKTVALSDDFVVAYNNRGLAFMEQNKLTEAVQDFTTAVTLKPDYALSYFNRALAHEAQNRPWEALQDAKKAYQCQSSNLEYYTKYKKLRALIESML